MVILFDPQTDGSIRVTHIAGDYTVYGVHLVLHAPSGEVLDGNWRPGDVYLIPAPE